MELADAGDNKAAKRTVFSAFNRLPRTKYPRGFDIVVEVVVELQALTSNAEPNLLFTRLGVPVRWGGYFTHPDNWR